jgi:glycopeptide antibiotics resistance protein
MWLGPFVIGMAIIFMAEKQLRDHTWTDEELGSLRRLMAHPAWNVLIWIPIIALLIMLPIRRLENHMVLGVFLILPFQTVMRLQQIVKPKVSSERLLDWQNFAPIHSEHWGER